MRFSSLLVVSLLVCLLASPLHATQYGIAAVVNGTAITNHDVDERLKFVMASSRLPKTSETKNKIRPQILQFMINEELQKQEAERLDISITEDDMKNAIAEVEEQYRLGKGKFDEYVRGLGISRTSVTEQLKAQLMWQRVLARKVRNRISVTPEEIERIRARAAERKGDPEADISIMLLPVQSKEKEQEVHDMANNLVDSSRREDNFAELARQFSAESSAKSGGHIGWLRLADVNPVLRKAIHGLRAGDISNPVRADEGYLIVKVHALRNESARAPTQQELEKMALMDLMNHEAQRYIKKLREQSFIEIRE
ncbi:MAG: peptidylprolyl isomerase [Rickettsiales bacterium]|nr:peptidylprolyl isomerase [Rickettsiales bacterium]